MITIYYEYSGGYITYIVNVFFEICSLYFLKLEIKPYINYAIIQCKFMMGYLSKIKY